eukprot:9027126-Lingulodinium_polyedra.AAC.1
MQQAAPPEAVASAPPLAAAEPAAGPGAGSEARPPVTWMGGVVAQATPRPQQPSETETLAGQAPPPSAPASPS